MLDWLKCSRTAPLKFVHAIAMKTRSATKALRVEAAAADAQLEGTLGAQSPEILNLIAEALAADEDDILLPKGHLNHLARSCKVIKEAVQDAKDKLKLEYDAASALLVKSGWTVQRLVEERPTYLAWYSKGLTAADAPALTNVLKSNCLLYTSPSPRDRQKSRMPSSA